MRRRKTSAVGGDWISYEHNLRLSRIGLFSQESAARAFVAKLSAAGITGADIESRGNDGIIIDQKLDSFVEGVEPVDYFGAALAQNLRTLMAGKSDNISYKPIISPRSKNMI